MSSPRSSCLLERREKTRWPVEKARWLMERSVDVDLCDLCYNNAIDRLVAKYFLAPQEHERVESSGDNDLDNSEALHNRA